jgi:hypothetical protein
VFAGTRLSAEASYDLAKTQRMKERSMDVSVVMVFVCYGSS